MMRILFCRACVPLAFVLCWFAPVGAKFVASISQSVPVERLIANLERAAGENSADVARFASLARAHAMAYSSKSPAILVASGSELEGPLFPKGGPHVPFSKVVATGDPSMRKQAEAHLASAIASYEWALRINPFNTVTRLGYGWCLQQAGEVEEAILQYRRVIEEEWPRERGASGFGPEADSITSEAAGYLIPLLDPKRDNAEIARLREHVAELDKKPRAVTPIAIPLVRDLTVEQMVDRRARVKFDADGSDLDHRWSWIAPDAGWLVYDQAGDKRITSALQLFGNVTFWMFWKNGYEALCALDDDGSGELRGQELKHLSIWQDANRNAVSERHEVTPVGDLNVVALSCAHATEDESDDYVAMSSRGVTFADGSTRPTYDILLHRQPQ
jgi:hypothetical protein